MNATLPNTFPLRIKALLLALGFFLPLLIASAQEQVGTPEFAPDAADSARPFNVTVTCPTTGSTMRYSIDGTNPDHNSIPVPGDGKVKVGNNLTLKARAFKAGMTDSNVKSANYRVTGVISGGGTHILALKADGKFWAWGQQSHGRLANGIITSADVLTPAPALKSAGVPLVDGSEMAGGFESSLFVTADGKIWAVGENSSGQVGDNTTTDAGYVRRVLKNNVTYGSAAEADFLSGGLGVSIGYQFSTAVDGSGNVWAWGQRALGRMGDNYTSSTGNVRKYAQKVKTSDAGNADLSSAVQVRAGKEFALALTNLDSAGRGKLWGWGQNDVGQIADGTTTLRGYAQRVKLNATTNLDDVVDFDAGGDCAFAVRQDGSGGRTVWAWGQQANGRLGNGMTASASKTYPVQVVKSAGQGGGNLTNIVQIACGSRYCLALDGNGKVWSWGDNPDGQLGDGTTDQRGFADTVKTAAGVDLTDIVAIAAGGHDVSPFPGAALAIKSDGTIYAWGSNTHGETGSGSDTPNNVLYATASTFSLKLNNTAPTVSLALDQNTAPAPGAFALTATPADADGTIAKVDFYENGSLLATVTSAPWTTTVTGRAPGTYVYLALATDNSDGAAEDSKTATVDAYVNPDTDGDGLPDAWEIAHGLNPNDDGSIDPNNGALGDPDGEGIDNLAEYVAGGDPMNAEDSHLQGYFQFERWDLPGLTYDRPGLVKDLTDSKARGNVPDDTKYLISSEVTENPPGSPQFGARLRGIITAPVTGDYQFAISADDAGELWLSGNDSRFDKHRIAWTSNRTGRTYDSDASQRSAPQHLVAGQKYYLEALYVQDGGEVDLGVAWRILDHPEEATLSVLNVIGQDYLEFTRDPLDNDGDSLPDSWEAANGLDPQDGGAIDPDSGEDGDPDGDGLSNFQEYQLGTDPQVASSVPGALERQVWWNTSGNTVREFVQNAQNPKILQTPDIRELNPGAVAAGGLHNEDAQRLRGWIVAPVTGDYTFYIASSGSSELWLGTGASKLGKVLIAQVVDWIYGTGEQQWDSIAGQASVAVPLVAGERYYVEALQKGLHVGRNDSHMSIGWKRPDAEADEAPEVIPAACLASFVQAADDLDDDDLADPFETQFGLSIADNGAVSAANGPFGDQDEDGVPNWMEYQAETSPINAHTHGPAIPDSSGMRGFLSRQIWNGIPNTLVKTLTSSEKFVTVPDISDFVQFAESRYYGGVDFGERLRGRVIAPLTGNYTFWISGDNECELWLSTTASKFQRAKIAGVPKFSAGHGEGGLVHFREWGKYAMQRSAVISLVAGQEYYIEVLHKQEGDQDHLSVGWNLPGEDADIIAPCVIGGSALRSEVSDPDDVDDNGLPDSWEFLTGIQDLPYPDGGAYGDPDGDGLPSYQEYQMGLHPNEPSGVPGALQRQIWWSIGGMTARDFVQKPKFLQSPDVRELTQGAEASLNINGDDGQRLRGFITAPVSGDYTFHLAGSGSSELWLGSGESKFSKTFVAQVVLPTELRQWSAYSDQTSDPVTLVAGQRYYVEVLSKEPNGSADHHLSLGWKRPDAAGEDPEVIPAQYLTSFARTVEDLDDDDLPDAFEQQFGLSAADNGSVSPANGTNGDQDQDGVLNWMEFRANTSPGNAFTNGVIRDGGVRGFLKREIWNDLFGPSVSDLTSSAKFGAAPDTSDFVVSAGSSYDASPVFGERLRGRVIAPASGDYTFWVSGDNECEVWLSPTASKFQRAKIAFGPNVTAGHGEGGLVHFREWGKYPTQRSAPITLVAGEEYYLEILHKQYGDQVHLDVGWTVPGQDPETDSPRIILGSALRSYVPDAGDADEDGLPDSWERQVGLNPADNGLINPNDGSYGDPDADGFDNFSEYTNGTNPFVSNALDSDGDGVSDYDELNIYHTDPNVADATPPVKLADLPLGGFLAPSGTWAMFPGGGLRSFTRRGAVDFPFNVSGQGIYLIELKAAALPANRYTPPIPVIARVDGVEVGRAEVLPFGSRHLWLSPVLAAGNHTLTIDNRNVRSGESLEINSIAIYGYDAGPDLNGNGIPSWLEDTVLNVNGAETASGDSATSPVCFEGTARFAADAVITVAGRAGDITAMPGLSGHWYANVPLEPGSGTDITASFENGAMSAQRTITWTATNVFQAPGTIRVRIGDSLKFTAVPAGLDGQQTVATLSRDGVPIPRDGSPSGEGAALDPVIVLFDTAGTFTIAAIALTDQEQANASVQIEVLDADFGPTFSMEAGINRVWNLPGVQRSLVINGDLGLQDIGGDPDHWRFRASYPDGRPGTPRVLARLTEGGPIVAATTINVFSFEHSTVTGDVKVIDVLSDGTRVVEVRYVIDGPIPSDLSIWFEMYTDGALFTNGTASMELTAGDFDANGEARILFLMPSYIGSPRVCHFVLPYFYSSIGNRVWNDENGNGIQDNGEAGIANVAIALFDGQNNVIQAAVTGADGQFLFEHLAPGTYRLVFPPSLPGGLGITGIHQGGDGALDSDADPQTGETMSIEVEGESVMTLDAGYSVAP